MRKFVILTDPSCDLDKNLREKYDIEYLPMHLIIDGKDYDADLDWQNISVKEFYDLMRAGKRVMTAQISKLEYVTRFEEYVKQGFDVLSVTCSSALTASVKASQLARDEVMAKYPECKIICVDSLLSCAGLGIMCIKASLMRAEGKTIEEAAEWIETNKLKINQEATVEKLSYLKQAGRVSAAAAFFGGLLSVKPIIISDVNGNNASIEKVKGRKASLERLAERVKDEYQPTEFKSIFLLHGDCENDALELKEIIKAKVGVTDDDIIMGYIGPIIGASCGPGVIGVYFYGKEVTFDANAK